MSHTQSAHVCSPTAVRSAKSASAAVVALVSGSNGLAHELGHVPQTCVVRLHSSPPAQSRSSSHAPPSSWQELLAKLQTSAWAQSMSLVQGTPSGRHTYFRALHS